MRIVAERYLSRGYPEVPDDGTWDNEGGFVGVRRPSAYRIQSPAIFPTISLLTEHQRFVEVLIVDPETYAELELKWKVSISR